MKRGGPLQRRQPLRSISRLVRLPSERLSRAPLNPVSKKRKPDVPLSVKKQVWERANGMCELNTPGCPDRPHLGSHYHHVVRRSQGGQHDAATLVLACFQGHEFVHSHPALSYERGWLRRGTSQ